MNNAATCRQIAANLQEWADFLDSLKWPGIKGSPSINLSTDLGDAIVALVWIAECLDLTDDALLAGQEITIRGQRFTLNAGKDENPVTPTNKDIST